MKKIKIGIVEDEAIIAENLFAILTKIGYDVLEPVSSYEEALDLLREESPELMVLDIQLEGTKTGIDVAKVINEDFGIPFIFLTSNSDSRTLNHAKEVAPPAFLVKPFNKDDLFTSIEVAVSNHERKIKQEQAALGILKDSLFIKEKDVFYKVDFKDILFLKSDHVYIDVFTKNKKFVVRSTMNDLIGKLNEKFYQTHRSWVVNLDNITGVNGEVVVVGNQRVPLSKNYRDNLMALLSIV